MSKYISHLDLVRNMGRALKKADIPIWYTEGFNPHPFMTFALPLSLGVTGMCEAMDIRLTQEMDFEIIKDRLNGSLPKGLKVLDVTEDGMKPKVITYARYKLTFSVIQDLTKDLIEQSITSLLNMNEIIIDKKTKSGIKPINIKEFIKEYSINTHEGYVELDVILPAGSVKNINPKLIIDALSKYKLIEPVYSITRLQLYDDKRQKFI